MPKSGLPPPSRAKDYATMLVVLLAFGFLVGSRVYDYFFGLSLPRLPATASPLSLATDVLLLAALGLLAAGLQRSRAALAELNAIIEDRVQQRTEQLELANRELEAFNYSVSHDLRAPLRRIEGFADILREKWPADADSESAGYLRRIMQSVQRMGELIEGLLTLSQVAKHELTIVSVDLAALAADVAENLRDAQPDRQVSLSVTPGLRAMADPGLMRVVLQNLIGNAWKFTSRTPRALIEVGETTRDGKQVFFVRDNGAGFDMTFATQLFAPFTRLHNEKEFDGAGIGLATVQRMIQRHSGDIWAEAAVDRGATFYFTLSGKQ